LDATAQFVKEVTRSITSGIAYTKAKTSVVGNKNKNNHFLEILYLSPFIFHGSVKLTPLLSYKNLVFLGVA